MILVNGIETDVISVQDRGLQFGDGLFETMLLQNGKIRFLQEHFERLTRSCSRLNIHLPNEDSIRTDLNRVCEKHSDGVIKLVVTRGSSVRGYRYDKNIEANRVVSFSPPSVFPSNYYTNGIKVYMCQTCLGLNPKLAGVKHLNRLENVMARAEWEDASIAEGILRDVEGKIIEGTMTNLFFIKDDMLATPLLEQCGVSGIVRSKILQYAEELNINCIEKDITVEDLTGFTSAFVCNSVIGIWPVSEIVDTVTYQTQNTITNAIQDRLKGDADQGVGD